MYVGYLDDSRDSSTCVVTALLIPADSWRKVFERIKAFRRHLKRSDGMFTRKEWHATDFIAGRGRIADRTITKGRRAELFGEFLRGAATFAKDGVIVINAVFPRKDELRAYERVLNRIEATMKTKKARSVLVWDAGKEGEYRRLARKMTVYNPIPSRFGTWPSGSPTKNIPLDRVIEDPIFKDSADSYFLQLADFCAYALLRRESPLASKTKYGMDNIFNVLKPILFLPASTNDPEGICRP
jgi:Protein of unknown function (DUF3800)